MTMHRVTNARLLLLVAWVCLACLEVALAQTAVDPYSAEAHSAPFDASTDTHPVAEQGLSPSPQPVEKTPVVPEPSPTPVAKPEASSDTFEGWEEIRARTNDALDAAGNAPMQAGNEDTVATSPPGILSNLLRVAAALALIIALIIASRLFLMRYGRRSSLLAGSQYARVMGRVYLDPRTSVNFVSMCGKVLVLGVTQSSVTHLATFDAKDFDVAENESSHTARDTEGAPLDFLTTLRSSSRAIDESPATDDTEIVSLKGDIERLQRYLREGSRGPNE